MVYTYRGGEKADAAAKGKDVDHRSVACERAGRLHGPYANRPGPVNTRPSPARWFFKIIEPSPRAVQGSTAGLVDGWMLGLYRI